MDPIERAYARTRQQRERLYAQLEREAQGVAERLAAARALPARSAPATPVAAPEVRAAPSRPRLRTKTRVRQGPPDRDATAADLAAARRELGSAVGQQPFTDYVRANYGRVSLTNVREFLRGQEPSQVFAPPPRSDGKQATTGHTDDWHLDLISLPRSDAEFKYTMVAQNVYVFAEPLKSTATAGPEGTGAIFERLLARAEATNPRQSRSMLATFQIH